ncbi:MAG: hypothetical protein QNI87_01330 [Erythrobacter sp.]|uniref:hypothetical protein n=1 Tax=Erythrobacter sp. TaxID=1042 RepID=UPI002639C5B4|nr:hypothetical protein [Erythrobacter sp.]MDJ0977157.1 hypothetical protein [Erythrobacter sp.]
MGESALPEESECTRFRAAVKDNSQRKWRFAAILGAFVMKFDALDSKRRETFAHA